MFREIIEYDISFYTRASHRFYAEQKVRELIESWSAARPESLFRLAILAELCLRSPDNRSYGEVFATLAATEDESLRELAASVLRR